MLVIFLSLSIAEPFLGEALKYVKETYLLLSTYKFSVCLVARIITDRLLQVRAWQFASYTFSRVIALIYGRLNTKNI